MAHSLFSKTDFKNKAKQNRPALILKISSSDFSPLDRNDMLLRIEDICNTVEGGKNLPNIYLLHGDLTNEEMNSLYNHPKVSAHVTFTHGEGFGRPLLEASLSGKPIIAPHWSGHVDFLDKKHAILLGGGLVDVGQDALPEKMWMKEMKWYMVNHKQAISTMKNVKRNYRRFKISAKKLMKQNARKFSFNAMVKHLDNVLNQSLPKFTQTVDVKLPNLKKTLKVLCAQLASHGR